MADRIAAVGRALRRSARVQLTVVVTLLIILAEFAFLVTVYDRGGSVRAQRIAVSRLVGAVDVVGADRAVRLVGQASGQLREAGVPGRDLALVAAAADRLAADPSAAGMAQLRATIHGLADRIAARSREIDRQSRYIYVAVLLFVSLGWMVWFRRLVTRHRSLEHAVAEHQAAALGEHRLAELVRHSGDLVTVLDADSTVSYATSSAASVLGVAAEDLVGTRLLDHVVDEDAERVVQVLMSSQRDEICPVQVRMRHADGGVLDIEGTLRNLMGDVTVNGHVLTVRDVTERVELERRLSHQALHDPLTGLANRRLFGDRLEHALERRGTEQVAVLFCDLDDFKDVNDSLGHGTGDKVLTSVAHGCREVVRVGDTIARFGGDEFAVLMEDTDLATATDAAERLIAAIGTPMEVDGRALTVRASIGIAVGRAEDLSGEDVLRNADIAMYLAKNRGKGGYAVYEPQLHERALQRLQLRADLQRALRNDEFVLHYQPTVDLSTERISGFEALVRWQHPERGLLSPDLFIPAAVESGLIVALGAWALRTACTDAAALHVLGHRVTMSVNVAAAQLALPAFADELVEILRQTGLPARFLLLELTEGTLLQDVERVAARLSVLRRHGVRIAIDDFGTGYSSLNYLQQLPVDVLKIDKSFVDRVTRDAQGASLTEAIITMSRSLNLATVAEGVEQTGQADWLDRARCDLGQGYLWSPPVPLEEAVALLAAPQPAHTG